MIRKNSFQKICYLHIIILVLLPYFYILSRYIRHRLIGKALVKKLFVFIKENFFKMKYDFFLGFDEGVVI